MEAVKNNLPGKPALKLNFGAKFYKPFWFKASACRHGEYVKRTNEVFPQGNTKRKLNGTDCGSISGKKRLRIKFGMTEAIFYLLKTNLLRFQVEKIKKM